MPHQPFLQQVKMSCRDQARRQMVAGDPADPEEELTDYQMLILLFLIHCLLAIYMIIQAHYNFENLKLRFK